MPFIGCQRRLIWSCSEFKQWHYHRPSSTIGFLRNSEICLACRDLLQMFFKAMPKVSNIFHIFRKDRSLKRNKKRTRNGQNRVQKSPLVFKLLFSLGGFSWNHCSRWLFMSRPLGSFSGCTWHSQGPLFYDNTFATRSKYPALCFSLMTFFAIEGRIKSLNAQMLHVHETFFSSSYKSPQL